MKSEEIFKDLKSVQLFFDKAFDSQTDITRVLNERILWRNLLYYCMAEGTMVPLLDGSTVSIESLEGKDSVWIYGFDLKTLKIAPVLMQKCQHTGKKNCVEVFLDNGKSFICTEDHRILTWFGYQEAQNLKIGSPLIPFKSKYFRAAGKGTTQGYNQIFQPYDAAWVQTHRAVYDSLYGIYDKKFIIHHKNAIKTDNRPENLELMSAREHSKLTLIKHKTKILTGMTKYARSDEGRRRKSESAKKQWAEQRDRMLISVRKSLIESREQREAAIREYWANPLNKKTETERRLGNQWGKKGIEINCRVIAIKPAGIRKVYDMTVPKTSNFAIDAGVFVHNCGEQWIEYLKSSGSFRRRQTPDYIPTPVSNEIREFVRSTKALLLGQRMIPRVWPNTNEKEDEQAAEAGENLLTWMDQANDGQFFDDLEKVTIWLCLSGTAFMRSYPNLDGGKIIKEGNEMWRTGDVGTNCIIPFNVRLDTLGDTLEKKRWIGIMSLEDPEWVEDTFKVKLEMKGEDKTFLDYQKRLTKLVAGVSPWKGHSLDMQTLDAEEENAVLFRELEFKPTMKYPYGQYFISCGGKVIYQRQRLPIKSTLEDWHYSIADFHYNFVPGRYWSDAPVNDLISPQNAINEIDQALAINRKGMARPLVFMPGDVGLKRVEMAGVGFNLLSYNPIMGQKPQVENGTPLPVQVLEERALQKQQIQDSGGDPKNILRGATPSAQSSGIQLDILRETVERGKTPDIDRFNRSKTKVYKNRLLLAQEIFTEEHIIKIAGRGNKHRIIKFKAADLRGNTDVRLELDSGLLATKSGQTQVLLSMMQFGAFGDLSQNPVLRNDLYKRFGMSSFTDEHNIDKIRAEGENSAMASGDLENIKSIEMNEQTGEAETVTEDPVFSYDNHLEHYECHKLFALSPEFRELPEQYQVVFFAHMDAHRQQIDGAKPDLRQYVQIDKLFPMLTRKEQMQVLSEVGIEPDAEGEVTGLPESAKIAQVRQRQQDTAIRERNKAEKIATDKLKVLADMQKGESGNAV